MNEQWKARKMSLVIDGCVLRRRWVKPESVRRECKWSGNKERDTHDEVRWKHVGGKGKEKG